MRPLNPPNWRMGESQVNPPIQQSGMIAQVRAKAGVDAVVANIEAKTRRTTKKTRIICSTSKSTGRYATSYRVRFRHEPNIPRVVPQLSD